MVWHWNLTIFSWDMSCSFDPRSQTTDYKFWFVFVCGLYLEPFRYILNLAWFCSENSWLYSVIGGKHFYLYITTKQTRIHDFWNSKLDVIGLCWCTQKLRIVDWSTIQFELFWSKVTSHKHQISPAEIVWNSKNVL